MVRLLIVALVAVLNVPAFAAGWENLLDPSLTKWEKVGDGQWTVMKDGTLVGQRDIKNSKHQAWIYTTKEYADYDLSLEWWTRFPGNSGVSIRDTSRGKFAVGESWAADKTPSHIGYEIQIAQGLNDKYPTGSVYLFAPAKRGVQVDNQWNTLVIESRENLIRVKLNGQVVSEHPGEAGRPTVGPIGLQLHDPNSIVMFRNVKIREIKRK